jgi:hypothetical protein
MESPSQNPQNVFPAASTPVQTGLLKAEYDCPVCNKPVVTIEGNTLRYLKDHVREVADDSGDYVSLALYHHTTGGDFLPGKVLEQPFLVLRSSVITPLSNKS